MTYPEPTRYAHQSTHDLGVYFHSKDDLNIAANCYEKSLAHQVSSIVNSLQRDLLTANHFESLTTVHQYQSSIRLIEDVLHTVRQNIGRFVPCPKRQLGKESSLIAMKGFFEPIELKPIMAALKREHGAETIAAITTFNISLLFISSHQCDDTAAELLKISLALIHPTEFMGENSSVASDLVMMAMANLGYLSYMSEKYEEALFYFEKVVKHIRDTLEDKQFQESGSDLILSKITHFVGALLNLARVLDATECYDEAMAFVSEACVLGNSLKMTLSQNGYNGDFDEAELSFTKAIIHLHKEEYDQSLDMFNSCKRNVGGSLPLELQAAISHGMGQILFEKRNLHGAMENLLAALTLRKKLFGEKHSDVADTLYIIGRILHDREEYADAIGVYEKVLDIQRDIFGLEHQDTLKTLCNVARVHQVRGESDDALNACSEAIRAGQSMLGASHSFVVEMLMMKGAILHELGQGESAMSTFDRVVQIIDSPEVKAEDFINDFRIPSGYNIIPGAAAA
eukprot:CAMPEP_0183305910 /NCGR_PEP_ID=MMETSP0160_2-20130417/10500_1 /TAXON_ID=2839 ORGANISM="Odontella Sinensis, Strain Grunow 1884" /NCGR_SAMPLE_ID=MMETSP0160_2 /ASSEMBLY_ACC=CAM_ASM_000250 /LENGTH=511 /DNA_ID=CAMNT_0025469187 /DNA_START=20 /DNA_END=1555 /DNA_ORIENTATION=-